MSMIRATLQDIRDSDKKGRWWLTGAAWVGNIGQHDAVGAAASQETNDASKTGELAFDERLLALAKAQRMNTEVRRHIFCVIMGSNDFLDAYVLDCCYVFFRLPATELSYVLGWH